jgi:uncharacterized membrane protein (DUF4010 family)
VLIPFAVMGAVAGIAAAILYRRSASVPQRSGSRAGTVALKNPFSLTQASRFGGFFALVLLVVKLVQTHFPGQGLYMIAALAGLTDVDAITLSMAEYARSGDPGVAANAIVIATLSNTMVKAGVVTALGARTLSVPVLITSGAILAAGIATIALL